MASKKRVSKKKSAPAPEPPEVTEAVEPVRAGPSIADHDKLVMIQTFVAADPEFTAPVFLHHPDCPKGENEQCQEIPGVDGGAPGCGTFRGLDVEPAILAGYWNHIPGVSFAPWLKGLIKL